MSSMSQEDLDAGWDDTDGAAAKQTAEPVRSNTIPPDSMIRDKQESAVTSLVVPAGEQTVTLPVLPGPVATALEILDRELGEARFDIGQLAAAVEVTGADVPETAKRDLVEEVERDEVHPTERTPDGADAVQSEVAPDADVAAAQLERRSEAQTPSVRWMVWSGAALVFCVAVGYLILQRGKHVTHPVKSTSSVRIAGDTSQRSPGRDAVIASTMSAVRVPAVPSPSNAGQNSEGANRPLGESFSDAFVKHAASVNSNWAEVKKRPRVSETQSASRPKSNVSTSGENPLGVLDQLEKVRKAKRATSSQP